MTVTLEKTTDAPAVTLTVPTALLRAAMLCASTEETRYYLNGVYVDPKGWLVATDGHRMFCAPIDISDDAPFDGWIIPIADLKRALTGSKNVTTDISPDRIGALSCAPIDGTFPDWRRVIPSAEPSNVPAQFNPAYIADMGKIGDLLSSRRSKGKALSAHIHHDGLNPTGVTFPGSDHPGAFAILMPIRRHPDYAGDDEADNSTACAVWIRASDPARA